MSMTSLEEQKKIVDAARRKFQARPWAKINTLQLASAKDPPARRGIWISRGHFPAQNENALRNALFSVCQRLQEPCRALQSPHSLSCESVKVEFIGCRPPNKSNNVELKAPEQEKLKLLEQECESDMTILYLHGGGL